MEVVVFPTPPFWLAMARTTGMLLRWGRRSNDDSASLDRLMARGLDGRRWGPVGPKVGCCGVRGLGPICQNNSFVINSLCKLHLVLAHLIRIEAVEPFANPLGFPGVAGHVGVLCLLDHV